MHRSLAWATLALYPLAVVIVGAYVPEEGSVGLESLFGEFVTKWWWGILVLTALAACLVFVGHALRNSARLRWKRPLWFLAFLVAAPAAVPFYWWWYADAT